MALQAKTKKQQEHVLAILEKKNNHVCVIDQNEKGLYLDDFITFEEMAEIVDYLRTSTDKKKDLFEECWVAYRRKGIKQKARQYWNKLNESDMEMVMPHIKAYTSSREIQYQKDFERYLRDKVFLEVVYNGNNLIYDPTKTNNGQSDSGIYMPVCGGQLNWNEYYKAYLYMGYWSGRISDGYTDDNRPDGATVMLSNGRGKVVWNANAKEWNKA